MWDFSQPYRTEIWSKEVEGRKLRTPVCIPSYNRPDAPIFSKGGFLENTPELSKGDVFIFIRENQYDLYKYLEEKYILVTLPKDVQELGMTREYILQFGIQSGFSNIFMFDDRLKQLVILAPKLTRNNKLCMAAYPESNCYSALLLWEHLHEIYPTTVSGVSSWGHCWYPENINRKFTPNNPGSVWNYSNFDLEDCKKYNLHFYDTREYGVEDGTFLYYAMKAGLPS